MFQTSGSKAGKVSIYDGTGNFTFSSNVLIPSPNWLKTGFIGSSVPSYVNFNGMTGIAIDNSSGTINSSGPAVHIYLSGSHIQQPQLSLWNYPGSGTTGKILEIGQSSAFAWAGGAVPYSIGNPDLWLFRAAAGVLQVTSDGARTNYAAIYAIDTFMSNQKMFGAI